MPPRLRLFVLASLILASCDSEPSEQGPSTTTTTGMTGGEGTEGTDGDPGDTEGSSGCVLPSSDADWACNVDQDCAIEGDCCGCVTYAPATGFPGNCGGSCAMDKCEEWGITEAACLDGYCAAVGLSCNQALVTCKALPPACDAGFLPRVWGGCYTGDCLPLEACDWAPSCEACGAGQLCMYEQRGGCDYVRCVDAIAECQGEPPCCTGESWCGDGTCTTTADGFACN